MQNITVEIASKENFAELADWLVAVGQAPQQQCLHTWSGGTVDALRQEMLGYWKDGELVYVLAHQNEHLMGAMGSEFDVQLQRAWLRGPHVVAQDWEAPAGLLFTRLLQVLLEVIHRMDAYLNIENRRGRQFYIRQEFKEDARLNYDFWLEPA